MQLFHTSPTEIKEISAYGMFGECLCFSADVYQMSACDVITYQINIDDADIIEARSFFYQADCDKLNEIVAEIMELADCDEEQAQELLSQNDFFGDAEIDWRIQGYAGEAAKVLGYKAASADDEQGTVYIVPMLDKEADLERI